jgi:hypothetical protein
MYKKHIEHFLTVSLKYLFDFDYTIFHNAYMMLLMGPFIIKLVIVGMAAYLYEGIITVKKDLIEIKSTAVACKQNWSNSTIRETIAHNMRSLKSTHIENSFRTR